MDSLLPPPPNPDGSPSSRSPEKTTNLIRFQSELECLSNPLYLHELSTQKYLEQEEFVNYLRYLEYWREEEYVRFIVYPTSLTYLTLLQNKLFRQRLSDPVFISELTRIGIRHYETWRVEKPPDTAGEDLDKRQAEAKVDEVGEAEGESDGEQ